MIEVTKSFSETPYHSDLRTKTVFIRLIRWLTYGRQLSYPALPAILV